MIDPLHSNVNILNTLKWLRWFKKTISHTEKIIANVCDCRSTLNGLINFTSKYYDTDLEN